MLNPGLKIVFILETSLFVLKDFSTCSTVGDVCVDSCSNVYDPICGAARALDGRTVVKTFHNICHYNKIRCRLKDIEFFNLEQVSGFNCGIQAENIKTRRIHDFSIVGAHQACNHSCPTYCLDTYDPACAQIWAPNMETYEYKPMINHCHIDLYSCVLGVNVTIQPLIGKCYKNPSALNFMFNVASMKTLKLLSDPLVSDSPVFKGRRSSTVNKLEMSELRDFLEMVL